MHILSEDEFDIIESALQYKFNDRKLLLEALSHPSLNHNISDSKKLFSYEKLEFLGDAVLNVIISDILLRLYPMAREGTLAKRRASLVCREQISEIARKIDIAPYILMTEGEEKGGGRHNLSNLENVMEALIGAIYLDDSFTAAKKIVTILWQPIIDSPNQLYNDSKSELQELVQSQKLPIPIYELIDQTGSAHNPLFHIKVTADRVSATATGHSKKAAEKEAAKLLINILSTALPKN